MTPLFLVTLIHIGGERKELPVEFVAQSMTYLSIRWGQSGIYDLNLAKNVLTARSQKAQRKGRPHWRAENIELVRAECTEYLNAKRDNPKAKTLSAVQKHTETMPSARIIPFPRYSTDPPDVE